jgi:hypothetical protein
MGSAGFQSVRRSILSLPPRVGRQRRVIPHAPARQDARAPQCPRSYERRGSGGGWSHFAIVKNSIDDIQNFWDRVMSSSRPGCSSRTFLPLPFTQESARSSLSLLTQSPMAGHSQRPNIHPGSTIQVRQGLLASRACPAYVGPCAWPVCFRLDEATARCPACVVAAVHEVA